MKPMSDRLLTRREEARLLKAGQRALLQGEFPNPERSGCPDKETLRSIATRKLSLEQVVEWVDHVGFCSPCYVEYDALRRQAVSRRWMQFGAIAAGIAIVVALGIWAWFGGWRQHPVGRGGEVRTGRLGRIKSADSISETGLSYVAEESKAPSHRLRPWS